MISLFIYKNIMIKSNINKIINCNIKDVNFIEYSKEGYKTFFEITLLENCKSIKLNLENENIKCSFIGNY